MNALSVKVYLMVLTDFAAVSNRGSFYAAAPLLMVHILVTPVCHQQIRLGVATAKLLEAHSHDGLEQTLWRYHSQRVRTSVASLGRGVAGRVHSRKPALRYVEVVHNFAPAQRGRSPAEQGMAVGTGQALHF